MSFSKRTFPLSLDAFFALTMAALLVPVGCKSNSASVDDPTLAASVQKQLSTDSAIAGQPIQTVVASSVVTLSGTVSNDAQRAIAARDAAAILGVKEVINNLAVSPASAQVTVPQPAPIPVQSPAAPRSQVLKPEPPRQPAPIERPRQAYNQPPADPRPYNPPAQVQQPAPLPAEPTFRTVTIPVGNALPVRITQTLDSATTEPDSTFSGVVASDIVIDGLVAIPAGSNVSGHVDAVHEAAHFKGSALLTVSLTSLTRRGDRIALTTEPYTVAGNGRGANTAEKTGGGAAVGAILGGIFGGGKGAAIGAAAGGGLGAGSNAVTRGQQVQIASESVVRFRLATPIALRVRADGSPERSTDPNLERHHTNAPPM